MGLYSLQNNQCHREVFLCSLITTSTPTAMLYNTRSKSINPNEHDQPLELFPLLGSGLTGAALLILPLRLPLTEPSSALLSKNPAQSSPTDSLLAGDSLKNSDDSDGVLGVRKNGELGSRKLPADVPGLARPACSLCSSVQFKSAAISCKIWNFFGSERSSARKCKKWFVTICLGLLAGTER